MIDLNKVVSVYSGKEGKCCCGCSGNHRYASQHVKFASKDRGYDVSADEVNDKQVRKVVKLILSTPMGDIRATDKFGGTRTYVATVNGRWYIAYVKD
jgi:hypothetical protein